MNMTHTNAIELATEGNWDKAWEVAQQDDGLNNDVTYTQWKAFAERCISQHASTAAANRYFDNYLSD